MRLLFGMLFLLASGLALAGPDKSDGPPVVPKPKEKATAPGIRFPVNPPTPRPPIPLPVPVSDVTKLTGDQLYVFDSDGPLIVLASPVGMVKIAADEGPLKIRGRFVGGTGKVETKTFKGKYIYTVEAAATGKVELIVIPVGVMKEADIPRKVLDVDDGTAPQPPPNPPDPPVPPTPADPLLIVLQLAYTTEPPSLTAPQDKASLAAVMRALAVAVLDPAVVNGDNNWALLHNSIEARIAGRLKTKLRPAIGAEINKILPNGPGKGAVALTDQQKKDAALLYLRIATLLDQVK